MNVLELVLLTILSLIAFMGGMTMPIGIVFIGFSLLGGVIITSKYVLYLINNEGFDPLILSLLPIILAAFLGYSFDVVRTEKTKTEIVLIKQYVNDYYKDFKVLPTEDNEFFKKYKSKIRIFDEGDGSFEIMYYDAIISSDNNRVYFRARP